jgi:hypothetical protein
MAYIEDVALALIRVLEHAALHKDIRLAGYAANIDFWANEIRHCKDCIAGYEGRFQRMKEARIEFANVKGLEVQSEWTTRSLTNDEIDRISKRLESAATNFLRACRSFLDREKIADLELLLGIRIVPHRGQD